MVKFVPKNRKEIYMTIIRKVWNHRLSWPFLEKVDTDEVTDYLDIVKKPIDLSVIRQKVIEYKYTKPSHFVADLSLMFNNATSYNAPGSFVEKCVGTLRTVCNVHLKKLGDDYSLYLKPVDHLKPINGDVSEGTVECETDDLFKNVGADDSFEAEEGDTLEEGTDTESFDEKYLRKDKKEKSLKAGEQSFEEAENKECFDGNEDEESFDEGTDTESFEGDEKYILEVKDADSYEEEV